MIRLSGFAPFLRMMRGTILLSIAAIIASFPCAVFAADGRTLSAGQLLIVANRKAPESGRLAAYYMKKRSVPARNLIELDTVTEEDIGRQEYERDIAGPIRDFLLKQDPEGRRFRCIVLMYGIPLRVGPPAPGEEEKLSLIHI